MEDKHAQLAALIMFTTEPTDRALAGWNGKGWLGEEMTDLGIPSVLVTRGNPDGGLGECGPLEGAA